MGAPYKFIFLIFMSLALAGCLKDSELDVSSRSDFGPQGLSVSAEDVLEGGISKITVSLNYTTPRDVKFHLQTVPGTADGGYNYLDISKDFTIPAGQSQVIVPLVSLKRNQLAQDRQLKLVISNSEGADIVNGETTVTLKTLSFVGELKGVTALGVGYTNVCVTQSELDTFCWGANSKRQAGGLAALRAYRVHLPLESSALKISMRYQHSCALLAGGKVWCWGADDYDQISPTNVNIPTLTMQPLPYDPSKTIIDVASGRYHTCVVFNDGTVGCKGYGGWGQLGGGNFTTTSFPNLFTMVVGLPAPAVSVVATEETSCAILNTGALYCWGENRMDEIGNPAFTSGATTNTAIATALTSGVVEIVGGDNHYCVRMTGGEVKCWGNNYNGLLGVGSTAITVAAPTTVSLPAPAVKISAGTGTACALLSSSEIYCWGINDVGQLGDGTLTDRSQPVKVLGLDGVPTTIETSGAITCTILAPDNRLRCWGANFDYAATASINSLTYPVDIPATVGQVVKDHVLTSTDPAQPYDSDQFACAIMDNNETKCWGENSYGQLGNAVVGGKTYRLPITSVPGLGAGLTVALELGRQFACAMTSGAGMLCFGNNSSDQVGTNSAVATPKVYSATAPTGLTSGVSSFAGTGQSTCAVMSDKTVKCWGYTGSGQAGSCSGTRQSTPTTISGIANAASVAASDDVSCAVLVDGTVKCWGANTHGLFANGVTDPACNASPTTASISGVSKITLGNQHACALTTSGGVKCWGRNNYGQVGVTGINYKYLPTDVPGLESGILDISAGDRHTCALLNTGGVKCWGANDMYQLGLTTVDLVPETPNPIPVQPLGLGMNIKKIHSGVFNTCAITNEGMAKCWGSASGGVAIEGFRYLTYPSKVSNRETAF